MKKKYYNILLDSIDIIGRIPEAEVGGIAATDLSYISAYKDYHMAYKYIDSIVNDIRLIEGLENTINNYKNKSGYDIEEIKKQIARNSNRIEKVYQELKDYISKRENQRWL